jgi:hypothetical protein
MSSRRETLLNVLLPCLFNFEQFMKLQPVGSRGHLSDERQGQGREPLPRMAGRGGARESILDIQETDTYTAANRCSTDLLAGVVQHPKN